MTFQAIAYSGAGQVEILVDGQPHGTLNLLNTTTVTQTVSAFNLAPGPHVLQVQAFQGTATVDSFVTPGRLPLFELAPPAADVPGQVGRSIPYQLLLTNKGTRTDTFNLELAGNSWPTSLSAASVTVAPGATIAVTATITVPSSATPGSSDTVTVTANSTVYPGYTAVSTLTTVAVNVRVQLCFALDGSGSISPGNFSLMTGGLASAVRDITVMPRDGSVELSIAQFAGSSARVELQPRILLGDTTIEEVATQIEAISQMGGATPMHAGIDQCTALITNSPYFADATRQVINLASDGAPTAGLPDPTTATINSRNNAVAAGIDQVNAEGIGVSDSTFAFLRDQVAYPMPGYEAPPFIAGRGGFAIRVSTFEDFEASVKEKVRFVITLSYGLDVEHRVPLANATVLTETIVPSPSATGSDSQETFVGWQYVLTEDEPSQVLSLQLLLANMAPGEVRQVASGTWISYTADSGSNLLVLPPLYVAAAHLVAIEPPTQTVSLGGSAVYQVHLFNPSPADLDLALSLVGLPAGWGELAGSVMVPAGMTLTLPLTVTTPAGGELGDYPFAVVVTTDSGGQDQAGALLIVDSPAEQFAIAVTPKYAVVPNGGTITYTVTVSNLEAVGQNYALTVSGLVDSIVDLPAVVSVSAGSAVSVPMKVTAAGSHGPHPFAVTATSLGTGTARSDDAVLAVIGDRRVAAALTPPIAVGGPGMRVPYTLTVTNTGTVADVYGITATLPDGWTYQFDANGVEVNSLALKPHLFNTADLRLVVTPALDAAPGDYSVTVLVRSQFNPNVQATASAVLTILLYGVRVELLPSALTMSPADTGSWQVIVTNTGSVADTYELSADGIIVATAQFSAATVSLAPGQSQTVQLTAGNMDFALPTTYLLGVTAQSQSDDRIHDHDNGLLTFTGYEAVDVAWYPTSQVLTNTLATSYMLVMTNTGNVGTVYDVTVDAPGLAYELQ
ncbi:MAG: DUF1194 domain-containing protein [Chloroflexi bacterium]|nr:DUF1194 domain-containing protein [Chloroflexota bacterium]MCI0575294.1 DUF1194 domain-containing protein [Chloroflexota bacterium]